MNVRNIIMKEEIKLKIKKYTEYNHAYRKLKEWKVSHRMLKIGTSAAKLRQGR